jgi:hypothetical protein
LVLEVRIVATFDERGSDQLELKFIFYRGWRESSDNVLFLEVGNHIYRCIHLVIIL